MKWPERVVVAGHDALHADALRVADGRQRVADGEQKGRAAAGDGAREPARSTVRSARRITSHSTRK